MDAASISSGSTMVSSSKSYDTLTEKNAEKPFPSLKSDIGIIHSQPVTGNTRKRVSLWITTPEYQLLHEMTRIVAKMSGLGTDKLIPRLRRSNEFNHVEPVAAAVLNLTNYLCGQTKVMEGDVDKWMSTIRENISRPLDRLRSRTLVAHPPLPMTPERETFDKWSKEQGFDVLLCCILEIYLWAAARKHARKMESDSLAKGNDLAFLDKAILRAFNASALTAAELDIFAKHVDLCQADLVVDPKKLWIKMHATSRAIALHLQGRYCIHHTKRIAADAVVEIDCGMNSEEWLAEHGASVRNVRYGWPTKPQKVKQESRLSKWIRRILS